MQVSLVFVVKQTFSQQSLVRKIIMDVQNPVSQKIDEAVQQEVFEMDKVYIVNVNCDQDVVVSVYG